MKGSIAERIFLANLESWRGGSLELVSGGRSRFFGESSSGLRAVVVVHNPRFYRRALFGGDVGLGEAWMDGDWSSPDLTSVVRLAIRNLPRMESSSRVLSAAQRLFDTLARKSRRNSVVNSRRNIREHYDLSNDFFQLFLDESMMYSCAYYLQEDDSLETAQFQKLELVCRKLRLDVHDRVLEIGTGWGGFAEHAARRYGCRVTTTTISSSQHDYARKRFSGFPSRGRIQLLEQDYRSLRGEYDKIVSIEMFEAVGLRYYDEFFRACDRLLAPGGSMLLQTIHMNEQAFPAYSRRCDWIQKHIFPGAELASLSEILRSAARVTSMQLHHAENIGAHYARTLAEWRRRFRQSDRQVRKLGFDERFLRMWDYYLCYCEGAFLERYIGDFQLLFTKMANAQSLFNEPWSGQSANRVPPAAALQGDR